MNNVIFTLHDSSLLEVSIFWQKGEAKVTFKTAEQDRLELIFANLTSIAATREFPWGKSFSINEVTVHENEYTFELQSGDYLKIIGELM